jgi:CRISPR-associated protein Cas2
MKKNCWHIIAYDISNKKRLARIHRLMRGIAYSLQHSLFAFFGSEQEFQQISLQLSQLIHKNEDDIRGYTLPINASIHTWGINLAVSGIYDAGAPPIIHHHNGQNCSLILPHNDYLIRTNNYQQTDDRVPFDL